MSYKEGKKVPDISYFMPLSNGARPLDGPAKCTFSSPSYKAYSPETQAVVKNLMDESKLTFTQKTGFQSILRTGKPLPVRPMDIFRQKLYKHRHAERARYMGIPVMNSLHNPFMSRRASSYMYGGRRSFETIQAAAEMDKPLTLHRNYIPRDKEQEKIRFAHRMAYGKDPPPKASETNKGTIEPLIQKLSDLEIREEKRSLKDERFSELIEEIKERIGFMESMRTLGNDKPYKATIVSQIQKLIAEMRSIYPEKSDSVLKSLNLQDVDEIFCSDGGYEFNNILIEKDDRL